MERLPPVEEQEWLLDCLRMLVFRRGASSLLETRILTGDELGAWHAGAEGVARVGRVLLDHAGLHDLELCVSAEPSAAQRPVALYHPGAPLYLVSFSSGLAHLALAPDVRAHPRVLLGLLAHELSHVWRSHHRLEVVEPELEERLTDLTSTYLGFGVLTLNLAVRLRVRHLAEQRSAWAGAVAPVSGATSGLGVESLAFLLAGQVLARRSGCLATCGVARRLEPEARRTFGDALRAVRRLPGGLPWRLRLPGHEVPALPRVARTARETSPEPSPVGDDQDDVPR